MPSFGSAAADVRVDAQLARGARHGDVGSLGRLFEKYRPQLYATAVGMLGYRSDAEDAVHDVFLTAMTRLHTLRDPGAVGGWLHAILRNRCLMEKRRQRLTPGIDQTDGQFPEVPDESRVEKQVESRELRAWVWQALGNLPGEQRLTVLLRYFGSYRSYEEVAAILGVPVGTVRSRLSDAKRKLADRLLAEAAGNDSDTGRITAERDAFYREAFHGLFHHGRREAFLAHFSPDLRWVAGGGPVRIGRRFLEAEVDDDLGAGVKLHPRRIIASGDLTLLEGVFENPREDPFHCPPGIVLGLFQRGGKTVRMHVHLSPRPPGPTEVE